MSDFGEDEPGIPAVPGPRTRREVFYAMCLRISKGVLVRDAAHLEGISEDIARHWGMDPEFSALYQKAREFQAHALAEQCLRITDGSDALTMFYRAGIKTIADMDPETAKKVTASLNFAVIQRDRLRLDARKWFTSKIAPKLYGEKLDITVNDVREVAELSDEQLDAEAHKLGLPQLMAKSA